MLFICFLYLSSRRYIANNRDRISKTANPTMNRFGTIYIRMSQHVTNIGNIKTLFSFLEELIGCEFVIFFFMISKEKR